MLTPFQLHVRRWVSCERCPLCQTRRNVVLCRGSVPCDVLICAEAPGESEDVLGVPMIGPAGKLFDSILRSADLGDTKIAWTNLVACIPRGDDGNKTGEPEDPCIEACKPRLQEFIALADPKLIIAVGALARDWLKQGYRYSVKLPKPIPTVDVVHPAAILRMNLALQGLSIQRTTVTIRNAVEEHCLNRK